MARRLVRTKRFLKSRDEHTRVEMRFADLRTTRVRTHAAKFATARCSCAIAPSPNRCENVYGLCRVRRHNIYSRIEEWPERCDWPYQSGCCRRQGARAGKLGLASSRYRFIGRRFTPWEFDWLSSLAGENRLTGAEGKTGNETSWSQARYHSGVAFASQRVATNGRTGRSVRNADKGQIQIL